MIRATRLPILNDKIEDQSMNGFTMSVTFKHEYVVNFAVETSLKKGSRPQLLYLSLKASNR